VIAVPAAPDPALMRWLTAIPAVRCVSPAFRPWTGAPDTFSISATPVALERFARFGFAGNVIAGMTYVAGRGAGGEAYFLARVPSANAVVMHAGSEAEEDDFTAVVAGVTGAPRALATLGAAPRLGGGLGLGSTRADVEFALGRALPKTGCGFDVVRYVPRPAEESEAELWIIYHAGRVVAFARHEAV
jgi:hypothetical protein